MRAKISIIFFITFLNADVNAQTSMAVQQGLFDTLAKMDSIVFANVYTCNTAKNETLFTNDLEFYHDKGGITKTKKNLIEELRNNFCGEGKQKLRRELIKGSLKVYPINNYGAVQIGDHRFYLTENGKESLVGVAKFIHVWKYENGEWKISRVFSYDHNSPDEKVSSTHSELYKNVVFNDSAMFDAFNKHDGEKLKTFFTKDLEFYHDKSGLTNYEQTNENFKKMFAQNNGIKREIVPNSLEVYPIKDIGALEVGEHKFCHVENGKNDCGTFPFIIFWQKQGEKWKVSRVISYNH